MPLNQEKSVGHGSCGKAGRKRQMLARYIVLNPVRAMVRSAKKKLALESLPVNGWPY